MNAENTIVSATDKSAPDTALRPHIVVVAATDISVGKPRDVHDSIKSEPKIYEQPGPSVSISDTITMTTPKSNAIKNSTETASDNIVAIAMETVTGFLKSKLTLKEMEQQEIEFKKLNIKVACEVLLDDLNGVTLADQKIIYTLNSIIKFYRYVGVDEDTNAKIADVEKILVKISTSCLLSFADDYVVERVQRINVSIVLFIDEKIDLECLTKEIKNFIDHLFCQLADFRKRLCFQFPDIFPMPQTETR